MSNVLHTGRKHGPSTQQAAAGWDARQAEAAPHLASAIMLDIKCFPGMEGGLVYAATQACSASGQQQLLQGCERAASSQPRHWTPAAVLLLPLCNPSTRAEVPLAVPLWLLERQLTVFIQRHAAGHPNHAQQLVASVSGPINFSYFIHHAHHFAASLQTDQAASPSLQAVQQISPLSLEIGHPGSSRSPVALASESIVMVHSGTSWASGVVLSAALGIVVANAHLYPELRALRTAHFPGRNETSGAPVSVANSDAPLGLEEMGRFARSPYTFVNDVGKGSMDAPGSINLSQLPSECRDECGVSMEGVSQSTGASATRVRVRALGSSQPRWQWIPAKILHVFGGYLDVAVLQVHPVAPDAPGGSALSRSMALHPAQGQAVPGCSGSGVFEGQRVAVIGHGLFGPPVGMQPSVTAGCIAKVVRLPPSRSSQLQSNSSQQLLAAKLQQLRRDKSSQLPPGASSQPPSTASLQSLPSTSSSHPGGSSAPSLGAGASGRATMIITTADVHRGASGGAVVDASSGTLLGLVTSNARHASGETIPGMNFSIAADELSGLWVWKRRCEAARAVDLAALRHLDVQGSQDAQRLWQLQPPLSDVAEGNFTMVASSKL